MNIAIYEIFGRKYEELIVQLTTTSTNSAWSPATVVYSGSTALKWLLSGGVSGTYLINDPTIDMSSNVGSTEMKVYGDSDKLTYFRVQSLNLTSLDVSNSTNLIELLCRSNQLTSLDVSNNTALRTLLCDYNQITSLDVTNNINLKLLYCNNNQLTSLDVTNNENLTILYCSKNQISSLDVTNNIALTRLYCEKNNMTATATDDIYNQLDAHGNSNGTLRIRNNRTSASDTAYINLIARGWTITTYTT